MTYELKVLFTLGSILVPVYFLLTIVFEKQKSSVYRDEQLSLFIPVFLLFSLREAVSVFFGHVLPAHWEQFIAQKVRLAQIIANVPHVFYAEIVTSLIAIIITGYIFLKLLDLSQKQKRTYIILNILFAVVFVASAILLSSQPWVQVLIAKIWIITTVSVIIVYIFGVYYGQGEDIIIKNRWVLVSALIIFMLGMVLVIKRPVWRSAFNIVSYLLIGQVVIQQIKTDFFAVIKRIDDLQSEQSIIMKLLHDIGNALTENPNMEDILQMIIAYEVQVTGARAGAILLTDKSKKHLIPRITEGFFPPVTPSEGYIVSKEKFLVNKFMSEKINLGESYIGHVAETRQPLMIQDALHDSRIVQSAKGLMDIRTVIAVPLAIQKELLGVIALVNKEEGGAFSEADFSLANSIADQAAITIRNFHMYSQMLEKRRDEREIEIASKIQHGMLPNTFPKNDYLHVWAYCQPAKGIGGDYFDFLEFEHNRLGVVMADVAGKGVPAALVMVMIRSVVRSVAKYDAEAGDVVKQVNYSIHGEVTQERYATMFYFNYDAYSGLLNYSNAAHGPMLVYRSLTDEYEMLDTPGIPVGIDQNQEYGQDSTILNSGDIAMLYTDGITEAMNEKREQYSIERVMDYIKAHKDMDAEELGKSLLQDIQEFAGEAPQHDDQTMIILKIT